MQLPVKYFNLLGLPKSSAHTCMNIVYQRIENDDRTGQSDSLIAVRTQLSGY